MARFSRIRKFGSAVRRRYSAYRSNRRAKRSRRKSSGKRSMFKKKIFGLPVWLIAIAAGAGAYLGIPQVKTFVNGLIGKK
jgi:hypothetical protein